MPDIETTRRRMLHAVTEFDRRQEAKAARNPRAYHNTYALPQYLERVADVIADIERGAPVAQAIAQGFTPGPLRNAITKALGLENNTAEPIGTLQGLPVYTPVTKG